MPDGLDGFVFWLFGQESPERIGLGLGNTEGEASRHCGQIRTRTFNGYLQRLISFETQLRAKMFVEQSFGKSGHCCCAARYPVVGRRSQRTAEFFLFNR